MGRRKIQIQEIKDPRLRYTTFTKRKTGLIKKAAELSKLCQIKMLLMFEDLSGDVIKYSTHGIYDPNKYFDNSRPSPYMFTFEDYPRFFGKEQRNGDVSEKNSLKGFSVKNEDHYLAEPELSIEEDDEGEDNGESEEEISSIKNLQREFKRHMKVSNEDDHNQTKAYKAKLRDSLKISIPKENGSQNNVYPAGTSNKNQNNSDFAKNLQALLMMQAQHARNLEIQPITFGESQESENKPSEADSARVSSTPTNRTTNQPIATPPKFNPSSTPTQKNHMAAITTISNTVNCTPTNTNRITPTNLKINYAKGFQQQIESQRMSFSQDEGSPRYQINSRPPSLLNSSLHSSVDHNIPTSRRSSLSSLLDLIKHDEKVEEDHLGDLMRAKSHTHSRNVNLMNRIDPKRLDDAFFSRKPTNQNYPNGQFFPNFTQKGMRSSLNFEELQLLGRDTSKMSVEPNNSQLLSQSQLTSRSGDKSESVDRFALKQLSNAVLNEPGSRSHSKDSHDMKNPHQRRSSGIPTGMRVSSIPLSSKTILGREERSPLRNPNYDMEFNVNPVRRETASIDSRKSGENSSINLGWGVWNEPTTSVRKDLDTTRGKLNISETSSIFKSPRPEKKVKPF